MQFWIINVLAVFTLCVICAGLLIPKILLVAFRKELFDEPDERKIHKSVVPRLGGIAFKPVVFFSIALVLAVNIILGNSGSILGPISESGQTYLLGFCSIMVLYLVGIADDLIGVRYSAKFVTQISCAIMLIAGGLWIKDFHGILWIHQIPNWIGWPFTIMAIVFIINSVNLIDGIDGLASGLCGIVLLSYGYGFFVIGKYIHAMLSFATLGVLVPFFYYNVFGNAEKQRKIFMGDTGSLTIGMMICFLSLNLLNHIPEPMNEPAGNPMMIAFAPLIIPCFDVIRVYLYRIRNGKNPFLPDKNHIHHKLLAIGLNQRVAMISILAVSFILTLSNILLSKWVNANLLLVTDAVLYIVVNMWLSGRRRKIEANR